MYYSFQCVNLSPFLLSLFICEPTRLVLPFNDLSELAVEVFRFAAVTTVNGISWQATIKFLISVPDDSFDVLCSLITLYNIVYTTSGIPRWLSGNESSCQSRSHNFDPGSERSPGEGSGNPLQYSCLGIPMDRGSWQAIGHGVIKSWTHLVTKKQHMYHHIIIS